MKQTYFGRTPILTLFTFFALALGSQWTFGQTQKIEDGTVTTQTSIINNCNNEQTGDWRACGAAQIDDTNKNLKLPWNKASRIFQEVSLLANVEYTITLKAKKYGSPVGSKNFMIMFYDPAVKKNAGQTSEQIDFSSSKRISGLSNAVGGGSISSNAYQIGLDETTSNIEFKFTPTETKTYIIVFYRGNEKDTVNSSDDDSVNIDDVSMLGVESTPLGLKNSSAECETSTTDLDTYKVYVNFEGANKDDVTYTYSAKDSSNITLNFTNDSNNPNDDLTGTLTVDGINEGTGSITITITPNIGDAVTVTIPEPTCAGNTFTGDSPSDSTKDNKFYTDANWSLGHIPTSSEEAIINTINYTDNGVDKTLSNIIVNNGSATQLKKLTIGAGTTLQLNTAGNLDVSGTVSVAEDGIIFLKANADNRANLKAGSYTGTGTTEVQVYVDAIESTYSSQLDYTPKTALISSPVAGSEKFKDFITNSANSDLLDKEKLLGTDNNSAIKLFGPYENGAYVNYISSNDGEDNPTTTAVDESKDSGKNIEIGKGYRVALLNGKKADNTDTSSDDSIEFTGNILTGDQTATVGSNDDGWDLIGNPYTSGLSLKAFVSENNNLLEDLTTGITYWDNTIVNEEIVGFVTKTKSDLDATDIVIPPGQAFFVRPKTGTTIINFTTSQQQIQTGASFNRNSNALEGFNITLRNSDVNKTTKVYLNSTTTLGVDKGHEAAAIGLSTKGIGIYTVIADQSRTEALAVQTIPTTGLENTTLKLGINAGLGEHTLSLEGINLPENLNVYVTDLENGSEILLNKNDYTFNVTDAPLEGADRFVISFQSDALSTGDNALEQLQIAAFKNTIMVKGDLKNNTTLKVYDLQGRKVAQTTLSNNNRQLTVNNSAGIYLVNLSNAQGSKTQKVILK